MYGRESSLASLVDHSVRLLRFSGRTPLPKCFYLNDDCIDFVIIMKVSTFFIRQQPQQFKMSGKLDYIRSELDLERVKDKLKEALEKSQVQKSKKTQRRTRQKVTPDATQVVTISDKKPSISLLLKQKLLVLALFFAECPCVYFGFGCLGLGFC